MTELVSQFGGVVGLFAAVIFGIFAVIGMLDKRRQGVKKEENDTEDRVMNLLRAEVDELTKKVDKYEAELKILNAKIDTLQHENKIMTDLLQGRDAVTQQFYKDAYSAIDIIKHNDKVSEENSKRLIKLVALAENPPK